MLLSFESLFSLRKETLKGFLPNVTHYLGNERYCTHKQILFNQTADILLAWFLTSWTLPSAKAKKLLNCKGFTLNLKGIVQPFELGGETTLI